MRLTIVLIVSLFSGLILAQEVDNASGTQPCDACEVSEKLKAMETRLNDTETTLMGTDNRLKESENQILEMKNKESMITTALSLLTMAFAFVHANNPPCRTRRNNNAYNSFSRKHILRDEFDYMNYNEWERYIRNHGLTDRPLQSFFTSGDDERVTDICNGKGQPLKSSRYRANLCISHRTFPVFHVKLDQNNRVTNVDHAIQFVVLACDVVENQCLPVHYEKYTNQLPNRSVAPCQP
ncbi:uncharacterized protein LOC117498021 [Trematomus bernacchii]|uniref:uncharacterized protein LOC117498021 n=1 Tax=Trematomus bernacchii TaxID=40690 RepID=UPI00146BD6B3|nr:uncharacterized protein LOC117498021 [Trematomus bernacchii]